MNRIVILLLVAVTLIAATCNDGSPSNPSPAPQVGAVVRGTGEQVPDSITLNWGEGELFVQGGITRIRLGNDIDWSDIQSDPFCEITLIGSGIGVYATGGLKSASVRIVRNDTAWLSQDVTILVTRFDAPGGYITGSITGRMTYQTKDGDSLVWTITDGSFSVRRRPDNNANFNEVQVFEFDAKGSGLQGRFTAEDDLVVGGLTLQFEPSEPLHRMVSASGHVGRASRSYRIIASFVLEKNSSIWKTGSTPWSPSSNSELPSVRFFLTDTTTQQLWMLESVSGTTTITMVDMNRRRMEGTFEGTLVNVATEETVIVTNGRFAGPIID